MAVRASLGKLFQTDTEEGTKDERCLKVITVISLLRLLWNLYLALTAGNRRQQVTSVVRRIPLVRQALRLHL